MRLVKGDTRSLDYGSLTEQLQLNMGSSQT